MLIDCIEPVSSRRQLPRPPAASAARADTVLYFIRACRMPIEEKMTGRCDGVFDILIHASFSRLRARALPPSKSASGASTNAAKRQACLITASDAPPTALGKKRRFQPLLSFFRSRAYRRQRALGAICALAARSMRAFSLSSFTLGWAHWSRRTAICRTA